MVGGGGVAPLVAIWSVNEISIVNTIRVLIKSYPSVTWIRHIRNFHELPILLQKSVSAK